MGWASGLVHLPMVLLKNLILMHLQTQQEVRRQTKSAPRQGILSNNSVTTRLWSRGVGCLRDLVLIWASQVMNSFP